MKLNNENDSNDSKESKKSRNSEIFYFNAKPDDEDNELYKLINNIKDDKNYGKDMTKQSPNSSFDNKNLSSNNANDNNDNIISIKRKKNYMECKF